jgi:branched-chain amino acid transport system substrate-binding protein
MKKLIATLLSLKLCFLSTLIAVAEEVGNYELHAAYALTGFASTFGVAELNGTMLAIEEFNRTSEIDGKKVKLVVEDTQSSNAQTLTAVRKLMSVDKAKMVLGPTWLDSFQAALPIADRGKILLFTPSAAVSVLKKTETQYPMVFSTYFSLEAGTEVLLKHVRAAQKTRIMLVFDQDPFFQSMRTIIQEKAAQHGLVIVSDESFDLSAADFRTALFETKKLNVEAAIIGFGEEKNLLTFLKQRKEINPGLWLLGDVQLEGYATQEQWAHLFDGVDFIAPQVRDRNFALEYEKRYKTPPILSASTAYDAATILLQGLKVHKRTADEIREYLLNNEFNTATFGSVRFNPAGGVRSSDFVIKKVRDKSIVQQSLPRKD